MDEALKKLYDDPNSHAAFSGVNRLWTEAKKKIGKNVEKKDVQHFLEGHRTYTLMRPKRVRFKRSKTVAAGYFTDVQIDLADFQGIQRHNRGHRYLLVAIDVLSKFIMAAPVRSKKAEDVVEAFRKLIKSMPMVPMRVFSDKGLEFKNKQMKELFDKEEIEKFEPTHSSVKASVCERAIRNIKMRLYRYFAEKQTLNWIDIVQKIIDGINHSVSRVHGMRPVDVNFSNAQKVWRTIYGDELSTKKRKMVKPKFKPGDFVRMSRDKGIFAKGYLNNYDDEILEVDAVKDSRPRLYKVKDEKGEKFRGSFYGEEMARVRKDAETTYRIEKVYRKRTNKDGTKDLLVKFIGYDGKEWIHSDQLV
jgi:hypothetical protein